MSSNASLKSLALVLLVLVLVQGETVSNEGRTLKRFFHPIRVNTGKSVSYTKPRYCEHTGPTFPNFPNIRRSHFPRFPRNRFSFFLRGVNRPRNSTTSG